MSGGLWDNNFEKNVEAELAKSVDRYYLTQDNSSHWFVVPTARREDWDEWMELDEDDEKAWEPPEFALRTWGSPSVVTFEKPLIEVS